jgi:hypothetical protein
LFVRLVKLFFSLSLAAALRGARAASAVLPASLCEKGDDEDAATHYADVNSHAPRPAAAAFRGSNEPMIHSIDLPPQKVVVAAKVGAYQWLRKRIAA